MAREQDGDAIPNDNAMSLQPLLHPHGGCVSPKGISLPMRKKLHQYPTALWAATAAWEGQWPWLFSHSETPFPGAPVMAQGG